jgi:hypothetical protein
MRIARDLSYSVSFVWNVTEFSMWGDGIIQNEALYIHILTKMVNSSTLLHNEESHFFIKSSISAMCSVLKMYFILLKLYYEYFDEDQKLTNLVGMEKKIITKIFCIKFIIIFLWEKKILIFFFRWVVYAPSIAAAAAAAGGRVGGMGPLCPGYIFFFSKLHQNQ